MKCSDSKCLDQNTPEETQICDGNMRKVATGSHFWVQALLQSRDKEGEFHPPHGRDETVPRTVPDVF